MADKLKSGKATLWPVIANNEFDQFARRQLHPKHQE
jgi:hypothetical protein